VKMHVRASATCLVASGCLSGFIPPASAWNGLGHRLVSRAAALRLPKEVPDFLHSADAISEVERLGPEPDRVKGTKSSADADENPGHFVDISDDETIAGVITLQALPATREAYDTALRAAGTNEFRIGFLPYSIIDGWYRIRRDFALWRVDLVGERKAVSAEDRAWFTADRILREFLTLRDIGVWSHYVGDASQPLHTSVHFNGWGALPNPKGYSSSKTLHERFEGAFVRRHANLDAVLSEMAPYEACNCPPERSVATTLLASHALVIPLYELEKADAFEQGAPEAKRFVISRLAAGASALRNLVVDAWRASATDSVGYPPISVADVESEKLVPARAMLEP
jgi:hypothetical protein